MSELIQKSDNRATIRWKLLTGASALALTAYVSCAATARAEDASRPWLWLEIDGQLSRLQDSQEIYAPPFVALTPSIFAPPQKAERPPLYSIDQGGSISFQPEDSNWIFSASIHYGRTSSGKHIHQQSYPYPNSKYFRGTLYGSPVPPQYADGSPRPAVAARFTDAMVKQSERHIVLDFQAGKDMGLGLFGRNGSSTISAGVRIAQFGSKARASLGEDPDWHFISHFHSYVFPPYYDAVKKTVTQLYHVYAGTFRADRSFHGIGPSIAWKASVPFAGNTQNGELAVDWGVNAALLFGRQRTKTSHQTTGRYGYAGDGDHPHPTIVAQYSTSTSHTRSRNVTVPNVGGSVGLSWQLENFKMSLGYKADFFFGAIDGGIDAAKKENRGFYGPYASISIGLGD